jgi:ketosteroid isomerase-like protein
MSTESTVRAYYRHVDDEELEELFALFSESIVYERPGHGEIRGMGEFRRFYLEERSLTAGTHTVDDVVTDENTAAVRGTFEGLQDGSRVEFGFADFLVFDADGQITRRQTFTDRGTV